MRFNYQFIILLMGLSLLGVSCQAFGTNYTFKGTALDPPKPLPDFELLATTGEPFHLSDIEGDLALIYFGYTFCPDVCPLTLADVKNTLSMLETGRDRVHVIFISVDPERDTPEALERYLSAFDASYIGLTDEPAKIQEVMNMFGVFAEKETVEDSAAGYLVSHTSRIFVINQQGELLLMHSFNFAPEDLQSDLSFLLQNEAG